MNNGNGLKFIFGIKALDPYKTRRLIEQFEQTRSKNTNWLLIVAYNRFDSEVCEIVSMLDNLTKVETIALNCINNPGQMTNKIFKEASKYEFDYGFIASDSVQFKKEGWDGLYYNASNYTNYDCLYFYDQENPVCNETPRNWSPVINRCQLKHVRDTFFTFTKYSLNKVGYYDLENMPILAAHDFFLRAADLSFNDKYDPYDAFNSEQYVKADPEFPPFAGVDSPELKRMSQPRTSHRVEFKSIYDKLFDCDKIVTFVMCLKERSDRAMKSIKSVVTAANLKYMDFIIVEDKSLDQLDLSKFKYVDKIKHYVVNTGDSWNRSKLLNFGFKRATTPLIASWDCDILFPKAFGKKLKEVCDPLDFERNIMKINSKESAECFVNGTLYEKGAIRGGMWLYDKNVLESVGGYDEAFVEWGHEEMDIHERLERARQTNIIEMKDINIDLILTHISHSDSLRGDCVNNHRNHDIRCAHKHYGITNVNHNGWGQLPILRKRSTDTAYANFLKGKRVAVVGPAPSIIGSKQRKLIDSYDVVVRINKAMPVPKNLYKDTGGRCDVLYNCMNTSEECGGTIDFIALKKGKTKWIACPYPKAGEFEKDVTKFEQINPKFPFHVIDTERYFAVENYIGTRPNTGIGTILDLLDHDIEELYITGFTFFQGGYHEHYRGYTEEHVMDFMAQYGKHDQEPQKNLIKELYLYDPRINVDETLKEILER